MSDERQDDEIDEEVERIAHDGAVVLVAIGRLLRGIRNVAARNKWAVIVVGILLFGSHAVRTSWDKATSGDIVGAISALLDRGKEHGPPKPVGNGDGIVTVEEHKGVVIGLERDYDHAKLLLGTCRTELVTMRELAGLHDMGAADAAAWEENDE